MHSFTSLGHFPSFPRTSSFCSSQVELRKREMHPAPLPGERGHPGAACEAGVGVQEGKGWQERPSRVPGVQGVSWSLGCQSFSLAAAGEKLEQVRDGD